MFFYIRVGDVHAAQGELSEAQQAYRDGFAIADHLAKADPSNLGWQHDMAGCYSKLASVHLTLGEVPEALIALRKGREIMTSLVTITPSNQQWKQDIALLDDEIAKLEETSTPRSEVISKPLRSIQTSKPLHSK